MGHVTTIEAILKATCGLCHEPVEPIRRGWGATCPRCDELLARGVRPSEVGTIRRDELAEAPTPEDWAEYASWASEVDRAFDLAYADDMAMLDEPDPSTFVDFDELYRDRLMAEYPATLGIGHPATED